MFIEQGVFGEDVRGHKLKKLGADVVTFRQQITEIESKGCVGKLTQSRMFHHILLVGRPCS